MPKLDPLKVYREINKTFPKLTRANKVNLPLVALGIRPGYFYEAPDRKVIGKTIKLWGARSPILWNMYYPAYVNTQKRKKIWDKYFSKLIAITEIDGYLLVKKGKGKKIRDMMKKKLDKLYQKVPYRTPYSKNYDEYIESYYLQEVYNRKFHPIIGKLLGFGKFVSDLKESTKSGYFYQFAIFPKKYSNKKYKNTYEIITIVRSIKGKDSKAKLKADDKVIYNMAKEMDKGFVEHIPELGITVYRESDNGKKTIIYDTYPIKKVTKKKTKKISKKKIVKKRKKIST